MGAGLQRAKEAARRTRKKAEPIMREFTFTGSVTLRGVQFFVLAADEDAAKEKARAGEFIEYETAGADPADWEMDPKSCQES